MTRRQRVAFATLIGGMMFLVGWTSPDPTLPTWAALALLAGGGLAGVVWKLSG